MYPAIFLDRDGVLIENRSDYVRDWSHVQIIPEAIRALRHLATANYKIVIVTNQSAVGQGLISLETAEDINQRLVQLIEQEGGKVDGVFMCPHHPNAACACRKPKPGLLLQAAEELNLNLKRSWMIGDAWSDVQAGHAAGIRQSILVQTGRGREQLALSHPITIPEPLICDNLAHALDKIAALDKFPAPDEQP